MHFSAFSLLDPIPPAPGHGESAPAPAPQTGQPAPEGGSAPPPPGGLFGGLSIFVFLIPMLLLMWLMRRSEQKKAKELDSKIKVGDQVITQSGLIGKLKDKGDKNVVVEIAPGVKVKMLRSAIIGVDEPAAEKAEGKAAESKPAAAAKKADG